MKIKISYFHIDMTSLGLLHYSDINDNPFGANDIDKNRPQRHNMTIKKKSTNGSNVQNMLKLINNSNGFDMDEGGGGGLADFNPPPRAQLPKVRENAPPEEEDDEKPSRKPEPEQMSMSNQMPMPNAQPNAQPNDMNMPQPNIQATGIGKASIAHAPLDIYSSRSSIPMPEPRRNDLYVPYYNQMSQPVTNSRDQLIEKLNYMIHMLEEQKDEKTGHVMEEVILYSFLGVFIIFIVDSFARAGKYTR
jgi:hypothetical protein